MSKNKSNKPDKIKSYRRRDRHVRKITRAIERRASDEFQIPPNAMVTLKSLPVRARDKATIALIESGVSVNKDFTTGTVEDSEPIMVPDPRRGMKLKGKPLSDALARREEQAVKIARKAQQRRTFATLKPAQKFERRAAGREHRRPSHSKMTAA
jgi:hypothetical protein